MNVQCSLAIQFPTTHDARSCQSPIRRNRRFAHSARLPAAHPSWTFSNTRESSSSPRPACRFPTGEPATDVETAVAAAERIGYPCVIKAQVQIGGRGKAGGIKVAKDADEARTHADAILGMDISGPRGEGPFRVHEVWVEGASEIDAEYYASIILDRSEKKPLVILSRMGGMNVEEIAETDPDALVQPPRRPGRRA